MATNSVRVYVGSMRWLLRVLAACTLLVVLLAIAVWLAWEPLLDVARRRLEPVLTEALQLPVNIEDAHLSLSPFELAVGDVSIGDEGAVLRVRGGRLTVRVRESLRRREPVADLEARSVEIAPLGFSAAGRERERDESPRPLPRFSIRRFRVGEVRVLIPAPDAPFVIHAQRVWGRVGVGDGGVLDVLSRTGALEISRGDRALSLLGARAKVELHQGDVLIRSARIDGSDVNARVTYQRGERRHRVHGVAEVSALDIVDPALRQIHGQAAIDASVTGALDTPTVDGQVRSARLVAFEQEVEDIDARLGWQEKVLKLARISARHSSGTYQGTGELRVEDNLPFTLNAGWQATLANEDEAVGDLRTSATAALTGSLQPLRVQAEVAGDAVRTRTESAAVHLTGHASFADGNVGATATASQKTGNRVDAKISLSHTETIDGLIQVRIGEVPSFQAILGTPVTPDVKGVLTGDVRLAGTRAAPRFEGSVRGQGVTVFGATLSSIDGEVRGDHQHVRIPRFLVQMPRGSIVADGTFGIGAAAQNDWRVVVTDVPTQTLADIAQAATGASLPLWGGQANARANGSGPWNSVKLQGSAQVTNFYLQREPIERVDLTFDSAWPRWNAQGSVALGAEEQLNLAASGTAVDNLDLSLQSTRWDLSRVQSTARLGLRGSVQLNATAKGPPEALSGGLHLTGEAVEWEGRQIGTLAVDAEGRAGNWTLQAKLGDLLSGNGTLQTRGDWPLRVSAEWRDADLAPLLRPDPDVRIDSSGTLRVDVPLRRTERITGNLQVDRLDIAEAGQPSPLLSVDGPLVIVANGGRFELRAIRLRGTGTEIAAAGWFSGSGNADITVDADSDLALVEILSPAIDAARGKAVVDGRLRRQAGGAVQLTGNASFERVAFDIGHPWVAVNVNGRMSFRDSVIEIDTLTGRLAGGTFTVGGHVDVVEGPQLTWTASELAPAVVPDVEAEVSGTGSVRGSWSDMTVAGEMEVLRALYDRRFAVTDLIPLFQKRLAKPGRREPSTRVVRLDLRIVAPGELYVDNNIAKIEMRTDLKITGTTDEPVIAGPIEVLNGEVKFRGRTFTIETGFIEFRPELGRAAYLNITAQTVVPTQHANYTVDTHIVGTTDNYQVTFSSDDPSLSQTDLVSLVTFGKTVAELQQGGGGISYNDLIALAPGFYEDRAEETAQSLLGIDRIDLEPGYSKSTGVYEPRVTLGKDLTQDLTASLSSSFGVQRRQQVQLEYRVSPRISLLADWESATTSQAGAFGGEIKFRFPFRTFPGWAALLPWPGDDVQ